MAKHPEVDVIMLRDVTADEYEAARAQLKRADLIKRRAVRAVQLAEAQVMRELGQHGRIGVRSDGRVICKLETQEVAEKTIPAHDRTDLRKATLKDQPEGGESSNGQASQ
jgi:hypothetical protein